MIRDSIAILAVCSCLVAPRVGDAQLRIVTYNTATSGENFSPVEPRPGMETVLEEIGSESVGGISRPIDVLLLQEQASVATSTQAITELMNATYGEGTYARGRLNGGTNGGGRAGIVYNTQTVDLIQERALGRLSGTAQARQTLRYQLRPVGYDDRSDFYAYVNHYKSGSSASDQRRRNVEATAIRNNSDALGDGVQAIYAGDFNIQDCNETMFGTLTSDGAGQAIDPMADFAVGCRWKDNINFRQLHTQSPADNSSTGLIRGGVDDRFDFQLVTENLFDAEGLSLIPGSYHTFGNNGSHRMNFPINDSRNTALPRNVLNALTAASDHLPVVADYQLPAIMQVTVSEVPSRVLLGADLSIDITIENAAPVTHSTGADELDYSLEFGAAGLGQIRRVGSVDANSDPATQTFALPTQFVTTVPYGLNVRSDSQNAMNRNASSAGTYTVVAPAVASLRQDSVLTDDGLSLIVPLNDEPHEIPLAIHNVASEFAAALDLDAFSWIDEQALVSTLETFQNLSPNETYEFSVFAPTTTLGLSESQLLLTVSDEGGVFGANSETLAVGFSIQVALPGDVNLNNEVGFDDFLAMSANFGRGDASWGLGDFNLDTKVDFADFLQLSANFGRKADVASVPEPAGSALLAGFVIAAALWLRRGTMAFQGKDVALNALG